MPSDVLSGDWGDFFTPKIASWKVARSSGWVTWALRMRRAIGRMKRSIFTGFLVERDISTMSVRCQYILDIIFKIRPIPEIRTDLVKSSGTKVALFTILFQLFCFFEPVLMTLNISSSAIPLTFGNGTAYFAALSFLLSLILLDSAFASLCPSRSNK